jgi:monofunctional biosynthetic peptidoglycan transglycosylase
MHPHSAKSFIKRWLQRAWVIALAVLLIYLCYQPDVGSLRKKNPTSTTLIELRLHQARKARIPYHTEMIWRNLDAISPNLVHAVLLSEDDTFYQHHGFDFEQIQEAIKTNWREKRYAYGGSTLTQQLARTLYLSPSKNLIRKLKEALITVHLEHTLSKRRILELYLNVVEWGRGIYGAEAAARFYYGKSASDLSADEAAALASILPSPRRWSPSSEKAFMARRRTQLLERMQRAGYLPAYTNSVPADAFEPALPSPEVVPNPNELQGEVPHEAPEPAQ